MYIQNKYLENPFAPCKKTESVQVEHVEKYKKKQQQQKTTKTTSPMSDYNVPPLQNKYACPLNKIVQLTEN